MKINMKNLKEEIQRSKQLMGIAEGLNLPKMTPQSWFKSILKQTTGPHTTTDYPDSVFYKLDDEVMFEYDRNYVWVNYEQIWSVLEYKFDMQYDEIRALIKSMVEEHHKLESLAHLFNPSPNLLRWRKIKNWAQ